MKKVLLAALGSFSFSIFATAQSFTAGNIVVLQTVGGTSKASSQATLKEYTTAGAPGITVAIPTTGVTPFQTAGVYGGSEGFLSTSTDTKYLIIGGYRTSATFSDITGTTGASVPRAIGLVYPSGYYLQIDTSSTFYTGNDMRGGISDGTNFWGSGASNNNVDGVDYFYPGPKIGLGINASNPVKAYGLRIFNGQIYYSTQKAGPSNTSSQLGVFALGAGLPINGTPAPTQIINTASNTPLDFSFAPTGDTCYVAIGQNNASGGIQKWIKSGVTWSLAYTLGTGATNIGAYGLVVDYTNGVHTIYATTFESTGNRIIKIVDIGAGSSATTLVAATTNTFYKGVAFTPVSSGNPLVNLAVSTDTASEANATVVTVTANASAPVTGAQTVSLAVSGTGITAGDYTLSNTTITIPNGATSGSVTFTVVNDILGEGTEIANLTMSSPSAGIALGMRTTQKITIADNDGNNLPVIKMNTDSTTNYIDNGVAVSPATPFKMSGVINDPTDPGATLGVGFKVTDLETDANSLTISLKSSNTTVVPLANLSITGADSFRRLKITPAAVGYSNITVTVKDGADSSSYVLYYAASVTSGAPANTFWHTGMSDASDGVALDNYYYLSGDDELNVLNVYARSASGLPYSSYDYTSFLALPEPAKPEVDLEAAARSLRDTNKIYWMGSMSNGKSPFDNKPNRDRLFATNKTGAAPNITLTFAGYTALRSSIISWGDANSYNFSASAAAGVDSKSPSGFAAEGMVMGPDSNTLYIGLRAPLVPVNARNKAVIAPVQNFETWFNNGAPTGSPVFGAPIELDLGGRGIRDIIRISNGTYVIVAGNPGGAPLTGTLYKWTGLATDAPRLISNPSIDTLNMEGVMPVFTAGVTASLTSVQVITDKGDDVYYNDGTAAKDFNDLIYRKFRSDYVNTVDLAMPPVYTLVPTAISKGTSLVSCDTVVSYSITASAIPAATFTYSFSGATTGTGSGTGSGAVFNKDTTTVTITATNNAGTKDSTFTVIVTDHTIPSITAPAAVTVNSNVGYCYATNISLGTPVFSDNCVGVTADSNATDTMYVGVNTVRWVATDANGNTDTALQLVTVLPTVDTWTGIADSLWSNPANWSCGGVPTFITNVTIPAMTPYSPVVDIPNAACNNINIHVGAQMHFSSTGNALEIKGNMTVQGSFNASAGKVIMSGAADQQLAGITYGKLDIEAGSNKVLSGMARVSGRLTFVDGHIKLNNFDLTLDSPALIIGASAASFIITNDTGKLVGKNIDNSAGTVIFPVGSGANSYTPLMFSNTGTIDDFSVRVRDGVYDHYNGNIPNGTLQTERAVNKTWFIAEALAGGSNAIVTPQWNLVDEMPLFDRTYSYVSHYTGNVWQPGFVSTASGSDPYTRSMVVNSFSPFGVGSASSPLELKLLDFSAVYRSGSALLNWTATGEEDINSYTIHRSTDAKSFMAIGDTKAVNKSASNYQFTDVAVKDLNVAHIYYRLQLNYKNGNTAYSKVVDLFVPGANDNISLTPNPVTGAELWLKLTANTGNLDIRIQNMQGQVVKSLSVKAGAYTANAVKVDVEGLPEGMYILQLFEAGNAVNNIKFSKQ